MPFFFLKFTFLRKKFVLKVKFKKIEKTSQKPQLTSYTVAIYIRITLKLIYCMLVIYCNLNLLSWSANK